MEQTIDAQGEARKSKRKRQPRTYKPKQLINPEFQRKAKVRGRRPERDTARMVNPVIVRLGLKPNTNIVEKAREGFSDTVIDRLAKGLGISSRELASSYLGITAPTLTRRRTQGHLKASESDKVWRYAALMERAKVLFEGDEDEARRWLRMPLPLLGGETPLEHATSEVGARKVEQLIGRLEHGVFS